MTITTGQLRIAISEVADSAPLGGTERERQAWRNGVADLAEHIVERYAVGRYALEDFIQEFRSTEPLAQPNSDPARVIR